jgi:two-component system, LytTR family, sensor kinase
LVENAIRHGIERQRVAGLISIEARQEDKELHLMVRDNGRGLPVAELSSSERRSGHGIGLANTRARLHALYGRDQSFSITKVEPEGCRVDIHLPVHFETVNDRSVLEEAAR